jgi:hypothetical protein
MNNHLTQLPFLARAARCGLQRLDKTLTGRRDDLRRASAPRPPRTQRDGAGAIGPEGRTDAVGIALSPGGKLQNLVARPSVDALEHTGDILVIFN